MLYNIYYVLMCVRCVVCGVVYVVCVEYAVGDVLRMMRCCVYDTCSLLYDM